MLDMLVTRDVMFSLEELELMILFGNNINVVTWNQKQHTIYSSEIT